MGDNVDTDAIIPVRWFSLSDPAELGQHCMENVDPEFPRRVREGDLIVAGRNFGCGSSREVAPWAIVGAGIRCVIAESFARIFFRNAINIALPLLQCPEAVAGTGEGDELEADLSLGRIRNLRTGALFQSAPYPPFLGELMAAGGLVPFIRGRLSVGGAG
jgi:3-isopropylmalate dehydratase small subunit